MRKLFRGALLLMIAWFGLSWSGIFFGGSAGQSTGSVTRAEVPAEVKMNRSFPHRPENPLRPCVGGVGGDD